MAQQVGLVQGLKRLDQVMRMVTGKGLAGNLRDIVGLIQGKPVRGEEIRAKTPGLQVGARVGSPRMWRRPGPKQVGVATPKRGARLAPRVFAHEQDPATQDAQLVISALRGLGFKKREAEQAIAQAQLPPGASLEEKVRATLQGMNRG